MDKERYKDMRAFGRGSQVGGRARFLPAHSLRFDCSIFSFVEYFPSVAVTHGAEPPRTIARFLLETHTTIFNKRCEYLGEV